MTRIIKIKKGLDIPLAGAPTNENEKAEKCVRYGICPDDFPGVDWKVRVKAGQEVEAGEMLMCSKHHESLHLVSPVKGTVKAVVRGERRHVMAIEIEASENFVKEALSGQNKAGNIIKADDAIKTDNAIRETIQKSGFWACMRQRPFDIVPDPESTPRDIFVTAFDSAPLAPEILDKSLAGYLEKGLEVLARLTSGKVYLGVKAGSGISSKVAEVTEFAGPHPAGNVGVQIAAIKPVNKGETVWTLDAATAARIGKLFAEGTADFTTRVEICGSEAVNPHYVTTLFGADIHSILGSMLPNDHKGIRVISGNVLTGTKVDADNGFLHFPYRQVTLIPEGDNADEFMGWASMNPAKFSIKRTFPAFLKGLSKPFKFDSRIKGGHRAMILSEEFDNVFPFDIYPEYLLKAIIAKDIDRMEKLGIYEVAPEDFALPEFIDTSKEELQKIVRDGISYLRKEEA